MQKQIDDKLSPAIGEQNLAARRARIAASMREDGKHLQKTQKKRLCGALVPSSDFTGYITIVFRNADGIGVTI